MKNTKIAKPIKSIKHYSTLILFSFIILSLSLVDIISRDKTFSDLENRVLKTRPSFTLKKFLDGSFTSSYEASINDQFTGRNFFIDLKSRSEFLLGKLENNNIVYGQDGFMFEKLPSMDKGIVENNLASIDTFLQLHQIPTTFVLIPNAYAIYEDKLPTGLAMLNQSQLIHTFYSFLQSKATSTPNTFNVLDFITPFKTSSEDSLYYKTDHHWNTQGAYLGYCTFVKSLGLQPVALESLPSHTIDDFYGTYFSKSKRFNAVSDSIIYYDIPVEVKIDDVQKSSLYDHSKWQQRDKYAGFLWGNNGLTVIKSSLHLNHQEGTTSRLLVIKDSFANAFVPFLSYNFDEIYIVDLRALPIPLSTLIDSYAFDEVLIMYNFSNFITDTSITRIKR